MIASLRRRRGLTAGLAATVLTGMALATGGATSYGWIWGRRHCGPHADLGTPNQTMQACMTCCNTAMNAEPPLLTPGQARDCVAFCRQAYLTPPPPPWWVPFLV